MASKATKSTTSRKKRVSFNITDDIVFLRSALKRNPWELGDDEWKNVVQDYSHKCNSVSTLKSLKQRVNRLLEKYRRQELKVTTGQEEEETERGKLLKQIDEIIQEEQALINIEYGADDSIQYENVEHLDDEETTMEIAQSVSLSNARKRHRQERAQADEERSRYMDAADEPEDASSMRKQRLSADETMMLKRQEHEMAMEIERNNLEKRREARFEEEGRHRDAIAQSQIEVQATILEMMKQFMAK